jgi:MFS family permease
VRFTLGPLFIVEALHRSPSWSSVLIGVLSCGDIVGFVAGGRLVDRVGRRRVLIVCFLLSAIATAMWAFTSSVGQLLPIAVVFGVIGGYLGIVPSAIVADVAGQRAGAMTTSRLAGDVGIMIGPLVGTMVVSSAGYTTAFLGHAATFLIGAAITYTARETRNQRGDGTYDSALF